MVLSDLYFGQTLPRNKKINGHIFRKQRGRRNRKRKMSLRRQSFQSSENSDGIPGSPGTDFPDLRSIPLTQFNCLDGGGSQPGGTRRPGFYADVETDCQVSTNFWVSMI